ncbi:unnamed protein product, partial [marine sediment metagenome]
ASSRCITGPLKKVWWEKSTTAEKTRRLNLEMYAVADSSRLAAINPKR